MLYTRTAMPTGPISCCRMCGATSYRPVIARDGAGAMTRTGLYRCSGCSVDFADPKAWREGRSDDVPAPNEPVDSLTATRAPHAVSTVPEPPDFKTHGLVPDRPPAAR